MIVHFNFFNCARFIWKRCFFLNRLLLSSVSYTWYFWPCLGFLPQTTYSYRRHYYRRILVCCFYQNLSLQLLLSRQRPYPIYHSQTIHHHSKWKLLIRGTISDFELIRLLWRPRILNFEMIFSLLQLLSFLLRFVKAFLRQ